LRAAALPGLLLLPAGCRDTGTGSGEPAARGVRLDHDAITLPDGDSVRLTLAVTDQDGRPFDLPAGSTVTWTSSDPAVAAVEGAGVSVRVTAQRRGTARIRATLGALADSAEVTVTPLATRLLYLSGNDQQGPAATGLRDSVAVRAADRHGEGVEGVAVRFTVTGGEGSVSPESALTGPDGVAKAAWMLGPGQGDNRLQASAGTLPPAEREVSFRATAAGEAPLGVASISPDTMRPGGTLTFTGHGFADTPAGNLVRIGGVAAAVTAATPTQLTVQVPAQRHLPCVSGAPASVEVTAAGFTARRAHPLRTALPRALAVGEGVTLTSQDDARCSTLPAGRYLATVFNAGRSVNAVSGYFLRVQDEAGALADVRPAPVSAPTPAPPAASAADDPHLRVLEQSRALVRRLGPPPRRGREVRASVSADPVPLPAVGDTNSFRVPNIDGNLCTSFLPVRARAVYVGARALVYEDVTAPLAGTMDEDYRRIGREMDELQFDLLTANFGDPLAFDASTDANGRVVMLFTRVVNQFGGIAGFVTSADFFPRTSCASSNLAEIFYALVPTSGTPGFLAGTRESWFRSIRSTVIHEVKHLASYAERFSRGARVLEETWLEEATARTSEELWARSVYGFSGKTNTGYAAGIYCEQRPTLATCLGKPLAMLKHFGVLYDFYEEMGELSPLGSARGSDATFYASGWLLVRWAADHFGASDAAFLQALTQEGDLSGVDNLAARAGRSWAEVLGAWSMAVAADDLPGLAPLDPRYTHPSWNTRDVFLGMSAAAPGSFPRAFPLPPETIPAGTMLMTRALAGGAAHVFELAPHATRRVVELAGQATPAPPATLGITLLRIQ
ncbi:MAG TPA: Ig-like domain-containing protein, partial [Longimicrobiaceae bacterium]|nr:Ig-like domain-containing protein [Longimicrobiaceae bacterium]